jgi:carbon storage regulator
MDTELPIPAQVRVQMRRNERRRAARIERTGALVLTRRTGQKIVIGGEVEVEVAFISHTTVKLAVRAPRNVRVDREEIAVARRRADMLSGGARAEQMRAEGSRRFVERTWTP